MATVLVYAAVALICWLVPTRLPDGQGAEIINVYPMRLLGVVSVLLACIDWILSLPGRVSVTTAVCWAVGTLSLALSVTALLAGPSRAGAVQSLVLNIQRIGLTMSALLLFVLATQVGNTVTLCQLPPYSRPLVSAHRGPGVFARMGATRFRAIGGHSFSPDREPRVYARSGASPCRLPFSPAPSTAPSFVQREGSWREGEQTCWKFVS